jgi:hypothetical protein
VAGSKFLAEVMGLLFLLILGDFVSTYLCLTTPNEFYKVWEVNPLSAWMFGVMGIVPALALQAAIKGGALIWCHHWSQRSMLHYRVMWIMMLGALLITGYANVNNWQIYHLLRSAL